MKNAREFAAQPHENDKANSSGATLFAENGFGLVDLRGQTFGKLTALEYVGTTPLNGATWRFQCECGSHVTTGARFVVNGQTSSCGCAQRRARAARTREIAGQTFGMLTALRVGDEGVAKWVFKCQCGKEALLHKSKVLSGRTKSCGCLQSEDIAGQTFGSWTAIGVAGDGRSWLFRCACGTEKAIQRLRVTAGHTTSCGCVTEQAFAGRTFGLWTALRSARGKSEWWFRCACGVEKLLKKSDVVNGWSYSCGCKRRYVRRDFKPGQVFGKLTALRPAETRSGNWWFLCECGTETELDKYNVACGQTTSCGCKRRLPDIAGQCFNRLTAMKADDQDSSKWLFKCECGTEKLISRSAVVNGHIKSCGCQWRGVDITGQTYGLLTAIQQGDPGTGKWLFRCVCGSEVLRSKFDVLNGSAASCGCSRQTPGGIEVGQRFSRLVAVEYAGKSDGLRPMAQWKFSCDCGGSIVAKAYSVKRGLTTSCGCAFRESHASRQLDISVQTFGKLTAIQAGPIGSGRWLFRCACGKEAMLAKPGVVGGSTTSCGCDKAEVKIADMTGKEFGRLTAVEYVGMGKSTFVKRLSPVWRFRCQCGETKDLALADVRDWGVRSCGNCV